MQMEGNGERGQREKRDGEEQVWMRRKGGFSGDWDGKG